MADDLGAFLQCCALIPLLNAQFAVPPSLASRTTHHGWDVCLWQNMGNTGHRTQGTGHRDKEDPGCRHRQEGDSRGRQTRTFVVEDGAWLSLRGSGCRFLPLLLTLFPGI